MNKINYQKELDKITSNLGDTAPTLLLHSCCAPCSSYCIEYLSDYFTITVFYYNPNLYPDSEYERRSKEQQRLINEMKTRYPVTYTDEGFDPREFYTAVKGLEKEPEGGARCRECFTLRLDKTALKAKELNCDYFTTTLTISPLKDAQLLNEIGFTLSDKYGVPWLPSDFKKKGGFKRSTELSREYGLYRQNYCGCVFSMRNSARAKTCKVKQNML